MNEKGLSLLGEAFKELPALQKLAGFALIAVLIFAAFSDVDPLFRLLVVVAYAAGTVWMSVGLLRVTADKSSDRGATPKLFDVFISAPMASVDAPDHRTQVNEAVAEIKRALRNANLEKELYFAGSDRPTEAEYSLPGRALTHNWTVLAQSERYVAIVETEQSSSAFLEIGAALALQVPSVWFVREGIRLPFLMSDVSNVPSGAALPPVAIYRYTDLAEISSMIERHGERLFR